MHNIYIHTPAHLFYKVPISDRVMNNGSIYLHTFVVREGQSPDPRFVFFLYQYSMAAGVSIVPNKDEDPVLAQETGRNKKKALK